MEQREFKEVIVEILASYYGSDTALELVPASPLLQYLEVKTRSANRGSKARGSFANLYAIYVLTEDYLNRGFLESGSYEDYEGAVFSTIFERQRELAFGEKLQNHALNSRCNEEFRKYHTDSVVLPIVRDLDSSRYWINERLLRVSLPTGRDINIAPAVIAIIDEYVSVKQSSFLTFIDTCKRISGLGAEGADEAIGFVTGLMAPNTDARIFEIVSYAILRASYSRESIWIGPERDEVQEERLALYKTGRTNANDGGIDFVMRPLGRFYQVTETLDLRKYFLDIDKVQRFPITFVVKSEQTEQVIRGLIQQHAEETFTVRRVVDSYLAAVEEIINLPELRSRLVTCVEDGLLNEVLDELVRHASVEFQIQEADDQSDGAYP